MTKDEIKNRISMALKDPILQQGFEIICKENAELENIELRLLEEWCLSNDPCPHLKKRDEQLAKAKEIIKKFSEFVNNEVELDPEHPQEYTDLWNELCEKAEQFLSEVEDEKSGITVHRPL